MSFALALAVWSALATTVDAPPLSVAASTDGGVDHSDGKDDVGAAWRSYYDGESAGAWGIVISGGTSMAAGAGLLFVDDGLTRGLGGALLLTGALAAGGFILYLAMIPGMVDAGLARLTDDDAAFVDDERARMGPVIDRFTWLRFGTGAVTAAAVVVAFVGAGNTNDVVAGAGFGVAVTAFSLFVYDSAAASRGRAYRDALGR